MEFVSKTIYNMNSFTDEQCKFLNEFLNKLRKTTPLNRDAVQPLIKAFKKTYGITISWQVIDKFAFSLRRKALDPNMKTLTSARGGWVLDPSRMPPDTRTEEEKELSRQRSEALMLDMENIIMNVTEMEDAHCLFVHEKLLEGVSHASIKEEFEKKFGLKISFSDLINTFAKSARRAKIAEIAATLKAVNAKLKEKQEAKKSKDEVDEVVAAGDEPAKKKSRKEVASKTKKADTDEK